MKEPIWIVNDMGELGVEVEWHCFFLYKGESIEYVDGVHEDGTPILYRPVGKREFGEVQWPAAWLERGYREKRYAVDLIYNPSLSDGEPDDPYWKWRPLPGDIHK